MIENVRLSVLRCLPGATAGLSQKTALVTLQIAGDERVWRANCDPEKAARADVLPLREAGWPMAHADSFADWAMELCVAIQLEARDAVWRGRVLRSAPGMAQLALPYVRKPVLEEALKWALRWLLLWGNPRAGAQQRADLLGGYRAWLEAAQADGLAPNTLRFAMAAHARGWPVDVDGKVIRVGWGAHRQLFDSSFTGRTAHLAARTARDKHSTSRLLRQSALPVPPTSRVRDWDGALRVARQLGWPVVVKPGNQDQGTAVVPGIRDEATLRVAFDRAARYSPGAVIVEKHVDGDDHRLLVVCGRLMVATRRTPGGVTGDGRHTVAQLIETVNADPRRGTGKRSLLIRLTLDEEALACLAEQGSSPEAVPPEGVFVRLRRTANISTGGTADDVTARVHPDNRALAERAARIIGLDIAGVDFLCPDIGRSWREVGGAICEVNAQPGFRVHWLGEPARDLNGEVLERLFAKRPPRIPTAAITGTNGKTTTARMLHHIWQTAGARSGVCTTQGVWVGQDCVSTENLSGFPGARLLLDDPGVDAAVLELPRKGLIRFGHPCDRYDVAALLNVQDDHIGVDGIDSLAQMAELKAEVLQRASQAIVVNADDPLCLAMRARAACRRHVLVARAEGNAAVLHHCDEGGEAVFMAARDGRPWIVLAKGAAQTPLMPVHEIPATMDGALRFNEINALFAVALAWAQGLPEQHIRQALSGFGTAFEQNPGRYNLIDGLPFRVLLDYGHNPEGVRELCAVAKRLPLVGRRVLVSTIGNRFRHHLEAQVPWMVEAFDEIWLSQDDAYFRRNAHGFGQDDPLDSLLSAARSLIDPTLRPDQRLVLDRDPAGMLARALASAAPGDLVVMLAESKDAVPAIARERARRLGS